MLTHTPQELNLPKTVTKKSNPRNLIKVADDYLKPLQVEAFNAFMTEWEKSESNIIVLEGAAGSGKTYLVNFIIECLLSKELKCLVTAPTNKAVKVLSSSATYTHSKLSYKTIHSAFGLREKRKGLEVAFERDENSSDHTADVDIVVVDEVSMLNKELWNYVIDSSNNNDTLFLLVGDPNQLPPVKEFIAEPLDSTLRDILKIPCIELQGNIRQKQGNDILALANYIKDNLGEHITPLNQYFMDSFEESGVYYPLDREEFQDSIIPNYFTCPQFKENSNYAKVLCWTNKAVDAWNKYLRCHIFKDIDIPKIVVGEKLIADKPINILGFPKYGEHEIASVIGTIYNTNDSFEVVDITIKNITIFDQTFQIYECDCIEDGENAVMQTINVLHEESEQEYEKVKSNILKQLVTDTGKKPKPIDLGNRWRRWYIEQEKIANVKYDYAITVHKSQGSTYQNVFVDEKNISFNRNIYDRNRMLYTAVTRASDRLYMLF